MGLPCQVDFFRNFVKPENCSSISFQTLPLNKKINPLTGAAYASSSANALPSSTFPATIASFGFVHQPNTVGSHDSATLPASDGLTAGRGCPVGDAAEDRSPTLLPTSPEQQDELQETMSTPHPSHFQASSTPMVRQVSVTILLQFCGFLV